MADALDLAHRLPRLWGRVQALEVRASYARHVARRARDLSPAQAAVVDRRVAESADGRIPWTRFETLVEAAVVAADPEAAAQREAEAAQAQFVQASRSDEHGMRGLYVRAPFAVIARVEATVAFLAEALRALGDDSTLDQRRVLAVLLMADPVQAVEVLRRYREHQQAGPGEQPESAAVAGDKPVDLRTLLPAVQLFVHLYGGVDTEGVARVEGVGPVSEVWLRRHLGPQARFVVRPVLDLAGQAPVDAYEIPNRHRQAVHLMTPADTFPFSPSTSRSLQIDHTEPYRHGQVAAGMGQSRVGNYGPMTQGHHRIKTFGRWQVKQPFPGLYLWRDQHGTTYLVDHTGTRQLPGAGGSPRPRTMLEAVFADILLGLAA